MIEAAWQAKDVATVIAPTAVLLIGVITLLVTGERSERQRRRELHARALAAALAYAEMPFEIRRRQHEAEHRSAERVRLTTRFSDIQAELSVCQALIDAEGNDEVRAAFADLVAKTRTIAGGAARDAWTSEPIADDSGVNMPDLAQRLQELSPSRDAYARSIESAARSPWQRLKDSSALPPDYR